jgi:hypothetical protein
MTILLSRLGRPRDRFDRRHESERWPKIAFMDIKDYQKAA